MCETRERRVFLRDGSLMIAAAALSGPVRELLGNDEATRGEVRFGLITDLHYADKDPAGSRHYRETLTKLAEAGQKLSAEGISFAVELGDFIDAAATVEDERQYLTRINRDFSALTPRRHYVLGNHCVDTLTKEEFLGTVEQARSYYSFDTAGYHFIVLDACFRGDGTPYCRKNFQWTDANVPASELEWLQADLEAAPKPTIVFVHQRLDVSNHYGVKNAAEVRRLLEESNRVLAVFQGHSHQNDYRQFAGIHYCTVAAMVEGSGAENNAYCLVSSGKDGTLCVKGFRRQTSYAWQAPLADKCTRHACFYRLVH